MQTENLIVALVVGAIGLVVIWKLFGGGGKGRDVLLVAGALAVLVVVDPLGLGGGGGLNIPGLA